MQLVKFVEALGGRTSCIPVWLQRVQYVSVARARVWLPEELGDWRKNKQDQMDQENRDVTIFANNKW